MWTSVPKLHQTDIKNSHGPGKTQFWDKPNCEEQTGLAIPGKPGRGPGAGTGLDDSGALAEVKPSAPALLAKGMPMATSAGEAASAGAAMLSARAAAWERPLTAANAGPGAGAAARSAAGAASTAASAGAIACRGAVSTAAEADTGAGAAAAMAAKAAAAAVAASDCRLPISAMHMPRPCGPMKPAAHWSHACPAYLHRIQQATASTEFKSLGAWPA